MPSHSPVVVTGASGFIGSQIVVQLLSSGYHVRLLARGEKIQMLRGSIANGNSRIELFESTDIASDDLSAVLQGAGAILHVASPIAGRADAKTTLDSAINGTLNVLEQAVKYNVTKVVITASWAATFTPGDRSKIWSTHNFTESDWGKVTREEVLDGTRDPMYIYTASKILAEKAAWKFAEENRQLDLATINPPLVYGPFCKEIPMPGKNGIASNLLIYHLISGSEGRPLPPQISPYFCDVRDVAKAHVLALELPPVIDVLSKRFLISGGHFMWRDAVKLLLQERPDIANRLPSLTNAPPPPVHLATISTDRARRVLHMDQYIRWEDSVLAAVEDLLSAEKTWAAQPVL